MKLRESEVSLRISRRCFGEKSKVDKPSMVLMGRLGSGGARSKSCIRSEVEDRAGVWELPLLGSERGRVYFAGCPPAERGGRGGRGGSGGSTL